MVVFTSSTDHFATSNISLIEIFTTKMQRYNNVFFTGMVVLVLNKK